MWVNLPGLRENYGWLDEHVTKTSAVIVKIYFQAFRLLANTLRSQDLCKAWTLRMLNMTCMQDIYQCPEIVLRFLGIFFFNAWTKELQRSLLQFHGHTFRDFSLCSVLAFGFANSKNVFLTENIDEKYINILWYSNETQNNNTNNITCLHVKLKYKSCQWQKYGETLDNTQENWVRIVQLFHNAELNDASFKHQLKICIISIDEKHLHILVVVVVTVT